MGSNLSSFVVDSWLANNVGNFEEALCAGGPSLVHSRCPRSIHFLCVVAAAAAALWSAI